MNKENLSIIMLFVVIVAGALVFRAFYVPSISAVLNFSHGLNKTVVMYPYQKMYFPFTVKNTGSVPINNLSVGVFVGGNLTEVYMIALPPGKNLSIMFNYTALKPGNYLLSAILDPGKVYDISSRQETQDSLNILVLAQSKVAPYEFINKSSSLEYGTVNSTIEGYLIQKYLETSYGIDTPEAMGTSHESALFFSRLINLTQNYVVRIVSAYKKSENSSEVYLWMQGYLSPSIIGYFAKGLNLTNTTIRVGSRNITFVELGNKTTLCSWYSGGWLKSLVYEGNKNCIYVSGNLSVGNQSIPKIPQNTAENASVLAHYYASYMSNSSYSSLRIINNTILYTVFENYSGRSYPCSGTIENRSGREYCSTYMLPLSGGSSNLSLVKTVGMFGNLNITTFALVNGSRAGSAVDLSIQNMDDLGFSGKGANFTQSILGTCQTKNFSCYGVLLSEGLLNFGIKNTLNKSVTIKSISCYIGNLKESTPLEITVSAGNATNLSTPCYNNTNTINAFVPGETLNISIGYSLNGTPLNSEGKVYVVGFG